MEIVADLKGVRGAVEAGTALARNPDYKASDNALQPSRRLPNILRLAL